MILQIPFSRWMSNDDRLDKRVVHLTGSSLERLPSWKKRSSYHQMHTDDPRTVIEFSIDFFFDCLSLSTDRTSNLFFSRSTQLKEPTLVTMSVTDKMRWCTSFLSMDVLTKLNSSSKVRCASLKIFSMWQGTEQLAAGHKIYEKILTEVIMVNQLMTTDLLSQTDETISSLTEIKLFVFSGQLSRTIE